ncbi:MAG: SUMF1/EgtB/PvdO family nonheme iron enzyme [Flavobacteriales bacterium]|nr:SUMF1/EgtB/PvdO family nonheme iron enzyme [Flavobacteriales bacterium]
MKKLLIISILLLIGLNGFGQKKKSYEKELDKRFGKMPGATMVDSNLYVDQTEVTNFMWIEYRYWVDRVFGTESDEYRQTLLDTILWYNHDCLKDYIVYHHLHPHFRGHPVVGMTQQQAKLYAKWRSDRVFEMILIRDKVILRNPDQSSSNYFSIENYFSGSYNNLKPDKQFAIYPSYTLPSETQWIKGKYHFDNNNARNIKRCKSKYCDFHINKKDTISIQYNIVPCQNDSILIEPTRTTNCLNNNSLGMDFLGNVSEWLDEENLIIGGNWTDSSTVNFTTPIKNEYPQEYVGFRCVAEWKEYKQK